MLLRDKVQEQHSHLGRHFYDREGRERGREGGRMGERKEGNRLAAWLSYTTNL